MKVSQITEEEEEITIGMVETEEVVEAEEDDRIFFSFIRALETISQKLHREAMDKGEVLETKKAGLIPDEYKEFSRVFENRLSMKCLHNDLGTMQLNSNQDLNPSSARFTLSTQKNKNNWMPS